VEVRGQPGAAAPRVRRRLDGRHSWELGREIANTVSLEASQLVAGGQAPHAAASPELAPLNPALHRDGAWTSSP
jgi:hypothetical protein